MGNSNSAPDVPERKAQPDELKSPAEQARAAARQRAFAEQDKSLKALATNVQADTAALQAKLSDAECVLAHAR